MSGCEESLLSLLNGKKTTTTTTTTPVSSLAQPGCARGFSPEGGFGARGRVAEDLYVQHLNKPSPV